MAEVTLSVGGHFYTVACRDGEEAHLLNMGSLIDAKTVQARAAVGGLNEVRQLLFAALLLADELVEARGSSIVATKGEARAKPPTTAEAEIAAFLEQVALRTEAVATALEHLHQ